MKEKNKKLEGIYDRLSKIEKVTDGQSRGEMETEKLIQKFSTYLWIDRQID